MATTKTPTTKRATKPAAKAAKPAAAKAAPKQAAAARFGPTECHAPGCDGERYLKGSLLCRDHQAAWAAGTFRLSARGYARLNAANVAAGKPVVDPATGKAATGRRKAAIAATAASTAPVADQLESELAASVKAFATPALAAKARANRASQKGSAS